MKLNIIDGDGFIALVNNAEYQGFVDENWRIDQLLTHFGNQMQAGNIVIWQASNDGGGDWLISFQEKPSDKYAYRQFDEFIHITSGELFLTNYADLTMAAQFSDEIIPQRHNSHLRIVLENGWYKLTIRQLFDPNDITQYLEAGPNENIAFEIIISPDSTPKEQYSKTVHWLEL